MYETSEVREALISIRLSFEHKVIDLWGLVLRLIRRTIKVWTCLTCFRCMLLYEKLTRWVDLWWDLGYLYPPPQYRVLKEALLLHLCRHTKTAVLHEAPKDSWFWVYVTHKHSTLSFGKSLKACSFRKHFSYLISQAPFCWDCLMSQKKSFRRLWCLSSWLFNKRVIWNSLPKRRPRLSKASATASTLLSLSTRAS